jgi:membrane-bound metal-dependent hydrolase YbcI (DUF457 family)
LPFTPIQEYPVHRFLHSFLGATAAGLAATMFCLIVVRAAGLRRPPRVTPLLGSTSVARGELTSLGILLGGLGGGLSHPFLDGIMHADVRPFMPWSEYNPFLGLIGVAQLHLACMATALVGAVCVTPWRDRNA